MPSSANTERYTLSLHDALPIYFLGREDGTGDRDASGPRRLLFGSLLDCVLARWKAAGNRRSRRDNQGMGPGDEPAAVHRAQGPSRSEEHTSELQSHSDLVCRLLRTLSATLFPYTTLFRSTFWDVRTGQETGTPPGLGDYYSGLYSIAFSPDGKLLATGDHGGTIKVWDLATSQPLFTVPKAHRDRKSTRLNSSHTVISYAVFCEH